MKITLSTRSNILRVWSLSIFDNDEVSQVYGEEVRDFYQDGQRLLYDDDSGLGDRRGMGTTIFL